jgi:hypothetical protein
VIKVVSDWRQVDDFAMGTPVFSTNKTECHDITEILLKVALDTTTMTSILDLWHYFALSPF